jgi:hypothetical protein
MPMIYPRHQRRAVSVSDRSLSAPPNLQPTISVRQIALSTIVLQLQTRYRKCVHFRGGAYIEVEKVRTASLRTKGAYNRGADVRTSNLETVANLSQTRRAERHGGRCLQKAVYVRKIMLAPRRAVGVSRPLRRPSNNRRNLAGSRIAARDRRSDATGPHGPRSPQRRCDRSLRSPIFMHFPQFSPPLPPCPLSFGVLFFSLWVSIKSAEAAHVAVAL